MHIMHIYDDMIKYVSYDMISYHIIRIIYDILRYA